MNKSKFLIEDEVHAALKQVLNSDFGIKFVSLATVDGFHLSSFMADESSLATDSLAAISSTICAMSTSCSEQILFGEFELTTIETSTAHVLFLGVRCSGYDCVLCMAADKSITLGKLRFIANRLRQEVAKFR